MKGFIPLNEFARRIRVNWHLAYKLVASGKVRARSVKRGTQKRWYVARGEVSAILRNPPWKRKGYRGRCQPKRTSGPANARVNNPRWTPPSKAARAFKKRLP
jgi:hypothetical protein